MAVTVGGVFVLAAEALAGDTVRSPPGASHVPGP